MTRSRPGGSAVAELAQLAGWMAYVGFSGINVEDQDLLGGLVVRHADGSTARISPAGQVQQHGPRRLCDDITAIHQIWQAAGEPSPDRYRLTIDPGGNTIWLDDPHGSYRWNL